MSENNVTRTALVIDDSRSVRQMVTFTLRQAGFAVVEGENGEQALERIGNGAIDLVVTDLNMPVMDGIGVIRELRKRPDTKHTPILMLTTESQDCKKQEGRAAGATGWIVKPFDPRRLLMAVERLLP